MPRFYLTTPIYYVTDPPHLGTAYSTVNADAIARWHRLLGEEVRFLTGTDEHGLKVAEAAAEHGVSPKEWADRTSARFVEAWAGLDVAYDDFLRTTEHRHTVTVQSFLSKVHDNGYIYKGTYRGLYCVSCEDYYTLDELVDGRCPIHGRPVIEMAEENWFFQLSAFQDRLVEWYERDPDAVAPPTKRNEALSFIKGGLHDISITRTSLTWGIEVPWDPAQVFYVWYDALINYLTAVGYGRDDAEVARWWPVSHHLVGKEILRFHCVWWPAMCMAAGIDPPAHVQVHGWLLVGGQKLSKTMAPGTEDPVKVTDITPASLTAEFGVDAVRYHLLREVPLGADGEFSLESLVARYNADLANNLGNLVARVATVVGSKCAGVGPAPDPDSALAAAAQTALETAAAAWAAFAPQRALEATWQLIGAANAALEAAEPWKQDPGEAVDRVLGDALEVLRIVAVLASPAMPSTASEIWRRIGLEGTPTDEALPDAARWGRYPGARSVVKGEPLFPRRRD
ncbi:MAG TPA: class I tRNA ligase family protein [Acidimicrobiales bacterium]|nr:class I tRNA ligase family protein [Acidimicrobiales bacterium]